VKPRYWDTSCVLPLYIPEPGSAELSELAGSQSEPLASSQILGFEFLFAVHARVARKEVPESFASKVQRKFLSDLDAGRFLLIPLGEDLLVQVVQMTARLAKRAQVPELRTLDGIHLVTAQKLGSEEVVTNDKRMRKAAQTLGMGVLPV
jgi:predicted nucleic acid-binding protein